MNAPSRARKVIAKSEATIVKKGIAGKLQIGWVVIAVLFIVLAVIGSWESMNAGETHLLFFLMLIWSFPSSIIASGLVTLPNIAYEYIFGRAMGYGLLVLIMQWFVFFVLGYLQWFVVVPWIYRRVTRKVQKPT
jgi:hypothetical protein